MENYKLKMDIIDDDGNVLSTKIIECQKIDKMIKKYKDSGLDHHYLELLKQSLNKIEES